MTDFYVGDPASFVGEEEVGSPSDAPAAAQRHLAHLIPAVAFALTFFAAEPIRAVDHSQLFAHRAAVNQNGHFLFPLTQVRLERREEIRRTDHYSPIFFGRSPVVAQVSQPFWIGLRALVPTPDAEPIRQPDHTELHLYRVGYQTVGQPWALTYKYNAPRLEPESYTIRPTDQSILYGRTVTLLKKMTLLLTGVGR